MASILQHLTTQISDSHAVEVPLAAATWSLQKHFTASYCLKLWGWGETCVWALCHQESRMPTLGYLLGCAQRPNILPNWILSRGSSILDSFGSCRKHPWFCQVTLADKGKADTWPLEQRQAMRHNSFKKKERAKFWLDEDLAASCLVVLSSKERKHVTESTGELSESVLPDQQTRYSLLVHGSCALECHSRTWSRLPNSEIKI